MIRLMEPDEHHEGFQGLMIAMALLHAEKLKREQLEVRYNTSESHDIICQVIYISSGSKSEYGVIVIIHAFVRTK